MNVGEALVRRLADYGVDCVFGIPGVHTLELYRGLAATSIRHVTPRHEQGAGFMADGYARVAGRPGVAFVISGPGVTNVLTPVAQAEHDSRGVLVVSGAVRRAHAGRRLGVIHDLPAQRELLATVVRAAISVEDPTAVAAAVDDAWRHLTGAAGRPGPAHIQVPVDVMRLDAGNLPALPSPPAPRALDAAAIERAAALLDGAARPALILGGGAREAGAQAIALAERVGAAIGLTINAKGAVPAAHPLCVPSRMCFAPHAAHFLGADVLVCAGTQLSDLDWWGVEGGCVPRGQVIRIDLDAGGLDTNVAAAVGILGDAAATLAALADRVSPRTAAATVPRDTAFPPEIACHLPLVRAIDEALPSDRIVAVDSTQPGYAANHALDVEQPASWLMPIGYGTLGCALPMAIGAAVAAPQRPVLALAGDAGVLFTIAELATARDLRLPLPIVVWNNAGYGEIRDAMHGAGVPLIDVDTSVTDLPRIAEGFGCHGLRAGSLDEVSSAIAGALRSDRPTLIEVTPATRGIDA